MCLYPKLIINKKYIANKKNGGNVPPLKDQRTKYVPVGCGKCIECKQMKGREWKVRLFEEIKHDKECLFVTFTFSNESLNEIKDIISKNAKGYVYENQIATIAVRRFLERWRKKHKKSLKHWLITELGERNDRIHLHGIVWTNEIEDVKKIWKYGNVWVGEYVNEKTINYIIKYIMKNDEKHKDYNSKILTSSGIGRGYFNRRDWKRNKYKENETLETYRTSQGIKINLPIYYRNKIYSEEEREKLWIEKLDKQERWILGMKIDISEGDDEYYKVLKEAREKNKRLGYGSDEKNWDEEYYKSQQKKLKVKKELNTNKINDDIKNQYIFDDIIKKSNKENEKN